MSNPLTQADLHQFTGSEHWYRHSINRKVLYTDGVKYLADKGGAYWLLDQIALSQLLDCRVKAEPFQAWKLTVHADHSCKLSCEDGNGNVITSKHIEYTDFPLTEITLYFSDNTILLPSEW